MSERVHFIGIGGAGLSAIATVLLGQGFSVSGSDMKSSANTARLESLGATVMVGHAAENVTADIDRVVRSSAVPDSNVEVVAARGFGIPVVKRQDFLGEMMLPKVGIGIAGTHGKTTTTSFLAFVLHHLALDPTFIVGGQLADLGTNARYGQGEHFVIEADEYDHMFLGLRPKIAVITNVEHDHPDIYPTFDDMLDAYRRYVDLVPDDGLVIVCQDDAGSRQIGEYAKSVGKQVQSYGVQESADWSAEEVRVNQMGGNDYLLMRNASETIGLIRMRLPGLHNVNNSLAVLAVLNFLGISFQSAMMSLREFRGVGRRFELKGEVNGITIVDDYAHHPTELRATLASARRRFEGRKIWAMFQPHTYSRTKALLLNFAASFSDSDHVIITDIFASREKDKDVSAADIVGNMQHPDVRYVPELEDATDMLIEELSAGDVLITLGAGNGHTVGEAVLERLTRAQQPVALMSGAVSPAEMRALFGDNLRIDALMSRFTSARIGGPADYLLTVSSSDELAQAVLFAKEAGLPCTIIGAGSNILVSDAGIRGLTILNRARKIEIKPEGDRFKVFAESGTSLPLLARQCMTHGAAGFEWGATVPGTVGGAVVGNAGAHGADVATNLEMAEILHPNQTVQAWTNADLKFEYRTSFLKQNSGYTVLSATFVLEKDDRDAIQERIETFQGHRKRTQPPGATIGSMFKNPAGDYAGRLIEQAGLKGGSIGNASISNLHANFFSNNGDAAAEDVYALIKHARKVVKQQTGIELELEVELVGDWNE